MRLRVKTLFFDVLFIVFYLIAMRFENSSFPFPFAYFSFSIYISLLLFWAMTIKKRVIDTFSRRMLLAIVLQSTILHITFIFKTSIPFEGNETLIRWLTYLNNIWIMSSPVFLFFVALRIGNYNRPGVKKSYMLVLIPAVVLMLLVLTNDFHHLVFLDAVNSKRQFGYYLIILFIFLMVCASFAICFNKCFVSSVKNYAYVPFLFFLVGLLLVATVMSGIRNIGNLTLSTSNINTFIMVTFVECLIQIGLIPNNEFYEEYVANTSLEMYILDNKGKVFIGTTNSKHLPVIDSKSKMIERYPIRGGECVYISDISQLTSMNDELRKTIDELSTQGEMIKKANKLEEEKLKIEEENRLYDTLRSKCERELSLIASLEKEANDDESKMESAILKVSVLGTLIKRKAYLFTLPNNKDLALNKELSISLDEVKRYLGNAGIEIIYSVTDKPICYENICSHFMRISNAVMDNLNAKGSLVVFIDGETVEVEVSGRDAI